MTYYLKLVGLNFIIITSKKASLESSFSFVDYLFQINCHYVFDNYSKSIIFSKLQHEWRCSICIRGSATRDVQPSQSFLKATAAAQKRNQVKDLNHPQPQPVQVQQQQSQLSNEDSKPSPGIGAVINRVGKRQESFDANGGPPKPSRASR